MRHCCCVVKTANQVGDFVKLHNVNLFSSQIPPKEVDQLYGRVDYDDDDDDDDNDDDDDDDGDTDNYEACL